MFPRYCTPLSLVPMVSTVRPSVVLSVLLRGTYCPVCTVCTKLLSSGKTREETFNKKLDIYFNADVNVSALPKGV